MTREGHSTPSAGVVPNAMSLLASGRYPKSLDASAPTHARPVNCFIKEATDAFT